MQQIQEVSPDLYRPVLELNRRHADRLAGLCSPLKECFGIENFVYVKNMDDGRYLLLSNDQDMMRSMVQYDLIYRTPHFRAQAEIFSKEEKLKGIWPKPEDDIAMDIFRKKNCHFNGAYYIQERAGSLEAFIFAHDKHNPMVKDLFQNYAASIEKFISCFMTLNRDLCDATDSNSIGISPHMRENYPLIEKIFKTSTLWEDKINIFFSKMEDMVQSKHRDALRFLGITARELDILKLMSKGKTAKEIAIALNISHRTIEIHLHNIRNKTGCNNRFDLRAWFEEKFQHFL